MDDIELPKVLGSSAVETNQSRGPVVIQNRLVALSQKNLKAVMGGKYSQVIEACLTCLDLGNLEFGDQEDFQDEDGVEVGEMCMRKVKEATGEIAI
jgi:hypothetical protein